MIINKNTKKQLKQMQDKFDKQQEKFDKQIKALEEEVRALRGEDINKKEDGLKFRGSSNQRIIDIKKTLEKGEVVLFEV